MTTSLTDLARSTASVAGVPVYGVSALGIASIFERFPVVRQLFAGQEVDFTPESVTKLAPDAIAVIIACGTGNPGDKDAEAAAAALPVHIQAEMLDKIIALTMPNGVGPFVEMVGRIGKTLGINPDALPDGSKAADTNSPKQSNS
jgi:hypothetical protein